LRDAKQKKYESIENYYDLFSRLYVVISQALLHDIYLKKVFKKGLKTKVKMAIISMSQKTLVEVAKSIIMIEEEMLVRRKNITRYRQESYSEELEEFDEEEK
jgi:hypothetical protein